jgi:predicted DNA-binding transcriptional regulator AlpA
MEPQMSSFKILRKEADLLDATGLKRSVREELVRAGRFPPPVRLSARCRGWTVESIHNWLAGRSEEGERAPELDKAALAKLRALKATEPIGLEPRKRKGSSQ